MRMKLPGSSKETKTGAGCLTLFALPFAVVGVVTGYFAIKMLIAGPDDWQQVFLLSIFTVTFGGVGFGLMFAAQWGKRKIAEDERLRGLHPDEPWMWKSEWASGRIAGSSKETMWFAWGFGILWNLISCPTLIFLPEEIEKGNHLAALGLIFPVVGVGLLWWAIRSTLRFRKFGTSTLQVETLPSVIGGTLRGTGHTRLQEKPAEGVKVSLRCVRRHESRGKNSSSSERMIWEDARTLGSEHLYRGREGIDVPIDFHIPFDNQSSDDSDQYNKIIWRVGASAEVAGVDYETKFEVPVFKTADSSEEAPKGDKFGFVSSSEPEFDPKTAMVVVRPSALGGTEYYFGAAWNLGPAVGMTFFFLLFAGITGALISNARCGSRTLQRLPCSIADSLWQASPIAVVASSAAPRIRSLVSRKSRRSLWMAMSVFLPRISDLELRLEHGTPSLLLNAATLPHKAGHDGIERFPWPVLVVR